MQNALGEPADDGAFAVIDPNMRAIVFSIYPGRLKVCRVDYAATLSHIYNLSGALVGFNSASLSLSLYLYYLFVVSYFSTARVLLVFSFSDFDLPKVVPISEEGELEVGFECK